MLHIDRERIRKALDEFKTLQLESDLGRVIDISKFNEVFFGNLSVSEFILHSKRAINILEQSIRSENYKFLPIFANFNNEFGNGNLADNLVSLIRNIKNKDFDSASKQLGFIIHYINVNNLSNNIESHSNERIKYFVDLEDKLIKFSKQLEESIKKSNSSISDIENERKEFTKVIAASKKNLLAAQELLNGIKDKDNVINEKIVKAMENSERIIQMDRDIFKKRENLAKQLEDQLTNQINEYNKTKLDLTEIERMKAKSIEDDNIIKKALEDVNSYDIQFKERLAELNELIGKEAAVSLFYTFKERKKELNFSLIGWAIMTLLIGFVSAYFIWEVIKVQEAQFKENNGVNLNFSVFII
jgi:DNA repair exonuclease SbcCD ATPase subunit